MAYNKYTHTTVLTKRDALNIFEMLEGVCEFELISDLKIIANTKNLIVIEKSYSWKPYNNELYIIHIDKPSELGTPTNHPDFDTEEERIAENERLLAEFFNSKERTGDTETN